MARDEQVLTLIVEQSAAALSASGFPKMPARVLMALMVAETGLTAQELAERLVVSPAAISGAVRYLQAVGFVHRVSQAGSRRDRYELPPNAWYGATMQKNPIFPTMAGLADRAFDAIDDPGSAAAERVAEMARFYRFLDAKMPELLEEWDAIDAAR